MPPSRRFFAMSLPRLLNSGPRRAFAGSVVICAIFACLDRTVEAEDPPARPGVAPQGVPLPPLAPPQEELAEYMGQLQTYTHKLSLSAGAKNAPLAQLYLHESLALLQTIQEKFPEYERIPVALLIDRIALAGYEPLKAELGKPVAELDLAALDKGMEAIIHTCNACHIASQVPFIRIERNSFNPFLQSFQPVQSAQ